MIGVRISGIPDGVLVVTYVTYEASIGCFEQRLGLPHERTP